MRRLAAAALAALAAFACGDDDLEAEVADATPDASTAPPQDSGLGSSSSTSASSGGSSGSVAAALSVTPEALTLVAGTAATLHLDWQRGAATVFTLAGLPAGVTASSVSLEDASGDLTVTADAAALPFAGAVLVVGDAGGAQASVQLTVRAAPGALDASYGSAGFLRIDFAGGNDRLADLVLLPDDGVLAVGTGQRGDFSRAALAHVDPSGLLDLGFGGSDPTAPRAGRLLHDFGQRTSTEEGTALAREPDGRLVVAGTLARTRYAAARFDAAGMLDATFGTAGNLELPVGDAQVVGPLRLGRGPAGDLVLAGSRVSAEVSALLLGDLDAGLGLGPSGALSALAVDPSGSLVVVGHDEASGLIARFTADGALDPSFGANGVVHLDLAEDCDLHAILLQPDGSLVVAGAVGAHDGVLAKITAAGALDGSFGAEGLATPPSGDARFMYSALASQADGKLVVAGTRTTSDNLFYLAAVRFDASGALDAAFGTGGVAVLPSVLAVGKALRIQSDGRLVVGGDAAQDFVLARFWP